MLPLLTGRRITLLRRGAVTRWGLAIRRLCPIVALGGRRLSIRSIWWRLLSIRSVLRRLLSIRSVMRRLLSVRSILGRLLRVRLILVLPGLSRRGRLILSGGATWRRRTVAGVRLRIGYLCLAWSLIRRAGVRRRLGVPGRRRSTVALGGLLAVIG